MMFNKILGKIIKICIFENFSKFEVKFVSVCSKSYRLYHTGMQWCIFSIWEHGPKVCTKILKNNKTNKKNAHNC